MWQSFRQPKAGSSVANRILSLLNTHCNSYIQLRQIQAQLILRELHSDTTVACHFISTCRFLGLLNCAFRLYTINYPKPHIFICNQLIRAFSHSHDHRNSILIYSHMHKHSVFPNNYTFPFMLKSLSDLKSSKQGQCVHTQIIKLGHINDIYIQNSLLNLYASCGLMDLCGTVFDEMPMRDVVSWTTVITGYRENEKPDDALFAFQKMLDAGMDPNQVTMVNALAACGSIGALDTGVWIHEFIERKGWKLDVILGTSLIDMYGKCGRMEEGLKAFKAMEEKNVFTWNALIRGLALNKNGHEAVLWFFKMVEEGVRPDEVTLTGVLCACVHSGLVQCGREIFSSLTNGKYGFTPTVKHYACIVDLLARSGYLEEAIRVIEDMPFEPTKSIWGSFLFSCRAHGNLHLSELAAWKLVGLAPQNSASYVVLSNLYAEMGKWSHVEKIRRLMAERELEKDSGTSSVQQLHQEDVISKVLLA